MNKLLHFLSFAMMFSFFSMNVIAQSGTPATKGDGDDPYLGSIQSYSLNVDGVHDGSTNTHTWEIIPDGGSATDLSTVSWATISNATSAGGKETVEITFNASFFSAGDYVLRYTEDIDGCSTIRNYPMTVHANSFFLAMGTDGDECNFQDGKVFDWAANGGTQYKTALTYRVTANKESGFSFNTWEFKGTLSFGTGITAAFSDISVSTGTLVDVSAGVFKVTGIPEGTAFVDITVNASSLVTTQGGVVLAVSEGKAVAGTVSTPDNATGDQDQAITLKKLAGATNIVAN